MGMSSDKDFKMPGSYNYHCKRALNNYFQELRPRNESKKRKLDQKSEAFVTVLDTIQPLLK